MSITSEEVNYIIYRYMQESGLPHSAFTFYKEARIPKSAASWDIPPGQLVVLLQKGLQYIELETHLNEDGSEKPCDAPFSLVHPHVCNRMAPPSKASTDLEERSSSRNAVTVLRGHKAEVYSCAWNPSSNLLASASADGTARVWSIPEEDWCGPEAELKAQNAVVLGDTKSEEGEAAEGSDDGASGEGNKKKLHLTAVEWSPSGQAVATASFEGVIRVWDAAGKLQHELKKCDEPVLAMRWSKSGHLLLSANGDNTLTTWSTTDGSLRYEFAFHSAPVLDVAWRNNTQFASAGADHSILVGEVDEPQPLARFTGHTGCVTCIAWDPSGKYVASGAEDNLVKVWRMQSDAPVFTLKGHKNSIYSLSWSPSGPGSANPDSPLLLATASFDCKIKLWNMETGRCIRTLSAHTEPVYSVAFSPCAKYLASGSFDRSLHVWSTTKDRPLKTFKANGGIFNVCWNARGDKVAASMASNVVAIIDVRE